MNKRDDIFKEAGAGSIPFTFDQKTVAVIDDMMMRSIPCYWEMQQVTAQLAMQHYQPGTIVYDLGCSTGNTIQAIHSIANQAVDIVAVDQSQDMLDLAKQKISAMPVTWQCQSIENMTYANASVIIASYVLQFIPHALRPGILKRMVEGLHEQGIAIICDKLKSPHAGLETLIRDQYFNFKRQNGYSDIEIIQKEEALQKSLFPMTLKHYEQLFQTAGFTRFEVLFKYFQFTVMLVQK